MEADDVLDDSFSVPFVARRGIGPGAAALDDDGGEPLARPTMVGEDPLHVLSLPAWPVVSSNEGAFERVPTRAERKGHDPVVVVVVEASVVVVVVGASVVVVVVGASVVVVVGASVVVVVGASVVVVVAGGLVVVVVVAGGLVVVVVPPLVVAAGDDALAVVAAGVPDVTGFLAS